MAPLCIALGGSTGPSGYPLTHAAVRRKVWRDGRCIGPGDVTVPYTFTGVTGHLDARVWDVAPDGTTLLVTRGTYRIDTPAYDESAGTLHLPLFGNHWRLAPGHRIRLDLTQNDTPYLRTSNVPSGIEFAPPTLTLRTREAGTTALAGT